MHPCRMLKMGMLTINSPADFYRVVDEFLAWRLERDRALAAGELPIDAAEADETALAGSAVA